MSNWPTLLLTALFLLSFPDSCLHASGFKSRIYGKESVDIPTNLTKSIIQDKNGFIWIGSDNGLILFTGNQFQTINEDLPSTYVKKLVQPEGHEFPFVITDKGIVKITSSIPAKTEIFLAGSSKISDTTVFYPKSLFFDKNGACWISEPGSIVRYANGKIKRYLFEEKFRADHFFRSFLFQETADGKLIATCQPGFLFLYQPDTDQFVQVDLQGEGIDFSFDAFLKDSRGRIWLGTQVGLFELKLSQSGTSGRVIRKNSIPDISVIMESGDDLFIGTWLTGLYRASFSDPVNPVPIPDLQFKVINDVFLAKDGTIWITSDEGFGFINLPAFESFLLPAAKLFVQLVTPLEDGSALTSEGFFVFHVTPATQTKPFQIKKIYEQSQSLIMGLTGTVDHFFVSYKDGFLEEIVNGKKIKTYQFPLVFENNRIIRSISMAKDKTVYFQVTEFKGIGKISSEGIITAIGPDPVIRTDVRCIYLDDENQIIYMGSTGSNSLLYSYSIQTGKFKNLAEQNNLQFPENIQVNDLKMDGAGKLWIGTNQGILCFKNGLIFRPEGFLSERVNINALAIAGPDKIWSGQEQGLVYYDHEEAVRFDASNGFNNVTITGRALAIGKDGRVWAGTAAGVTYLRDPGSFLISKSLTPSIIRFAVSGKNLSGDDFLNGIQIPFNSGFEATVSCLMFPTENIRYQFKLAGRDSVWSAQTSNPTIFISGLKSGNYTLQVIARQNGNLKSDPLEIKLIVLPAWFETWWAYLLFISGLAALGFLFFKVRRNIQKRKAAESNLIRSEKQNRDLVNAFPDFWTRINRNLEITSHHHGTLILPFIQDPQNLTGKPISDIFPVSVAKLILPALEKTWSSGQSELIIFSWEHLEFNFDFEARILLPGGNEILILIRDISQQKQLERELITAREAALEVSRLKSDFLATMSHEIRTPMNGVIGMTSLLLHTPLTPEQTEYVQSLKFSGEQLLHLINDILDFSKIESGRMEIEQKPFSLVSSIEKVVNLFIPKASVKGLRIFVVYDPEVPEYINGDENKVRQILANLVDNAIKFTSEGVILVTVKNGIDSANTQILYITVRDTGIGIPESKQHKLFESFSQIDASVTRKYGGTGLGLAICKKLAILMGGDLQVQSKEHNGSRFSLSLITPKLDYIRRVKSLGLINQNLEISIKEPNRKHLFILKKMLLNFGFLNVRSDQDLESNKGLFIDRANSNDNPGYRIKINGQDANFYGMIGWTQIETILATMNGGSKESSTLLPEQKSEIQTGDGVPLKILVAEDNQVNQVLIKRVLSKLGYTCFLAINGEDALTQAKILNPDFIFMDVQMPVMDGLESTREIRAFFKGMKPVIIALTANAMEKDREICLEAGMNDYLAKPIVIGDVDKMITKWAAVLPSL
ncbi:MAG: response regulator [Bacteroidetes bacterium]|nr:response regulator [Bacteroidota bacterium]